MPRRHGAGLLAFAIAGATLAVTPSAFAFCRTTTVRQADNYNAVVSGCWSQGIPLFWRNACVGYSIQSGGSRKISYDDASNALSKAFTRWTGATCPTDGSGSSRVSIDVRDLGPAECAKVEYVPNGGANQNVIIFRDESWPYDSSVLGLTTVNYNPNTGELYNADMELNTFQMNPLAVSDPVAPDAYDFLSVATHEAGHFLGLAHSDVAQSTMFAHYDQGETWMRVLSPDDVKAICTVYRPDGARATQSGLETRAPQCDPTPRGGYSTQCADKSCAFAGPARGVGSGTLALSALAVAGMVRRRRRRER